MRKRVVFSGHQPNFLPYMGYFYKMFRSDVFVLDDDVQFSRTEFQNYNYIKVNGKRKKITIPVKYQFGDPINSVRIFYQNGWDDKLLRTLEMNYRKAPFFEEVYYMISRHLEKKEARLCDLNIGLIRDIARRFGIDCKIYVASRDVPTDLSKNERNIYQCLKLGGDVYYSGVGGREYNDEDSYLDNGIKVEYSDYEPVVYPQVGGEFISNLSVLDYIINRGFNIPEEWRDKDEKRVL